LYRKSYLQVAMEKEESYLQIIQFVPRKKKINQVDYYIAGSEVVTSLYIPQIPLQYLLLRLQEWYVYLLLLFLKRKNIRYHLLALYLCMAVPHYHQDYKTDFSEMPNQYLKQN